MLGTSHDDLIFGTGDSFLVASFEADYAANPDDYLQQDITFILEPILSTGALRSNQSSLTLAPNLSIVSQPLLLWKFHGFINSYVNYMSFFPLLICFGVIIRVHCPYFKSYFPCTYQALCQGYYYYIRELVVAVVASSLCFYSYPTCRHLYEGHTYSSILVSQIQVVRLFAHQLVRGNEALSYADRSPHFQSTDRHTSS